MAREQIHSSKPNPEVDLSRRDRPVSTYQPTTGPSSGTIKDHKTRLYKTVKRIAIVAVCSVVGSFITITVTLAITYIVMSWPTNLVIPLGGGFDFFLLPAMIVFSGFFGAVASFLLARAIAP